MAGETDHKANSIPGSDNDFIDAVVIEDNDTSTISHTGTTASAADSDGAKNGRLGAGWFVSIGLLIFIAGLFAAPQLFPIFERFGLITPQYPTADTQEILLPIDALQDDVAKSLSADITTLRQELAQQTRRLQAIEAAGIEVSAASTGSALREERQQAIEERLNGFGNDLASLTRTLTTLSEAERVAPPNADSGVGSAQIAEMASSLAILKQEVQTLSGRVAKSDQRARALEAGSLTATPRGRIFVALDDFDALILAGKPIGSVLTLLRPDIDRLSPIDQRLLAPHIEILEAHLGGVASKALLQQEFRQMLPDLIGAAKAEEGDLLGGLISFRRTDAGAEGFDKLVRDAERAINFGDLSVAYTLLDGGLKAELAPAREAASKWLERAKAHIQVYSSLQALSRVLLAEDNQ